MVAQITGPTPAQREFRAAMANLAAGVNIVTTDGPRGRAGITVSAVCSVTDAPPTVLVCVNRSSYNHGVLAENRRICINVLGADQQELALRFAGATRLSNEERFAAAVCDDRFTDVPVIRDAAASLIGRIADIRTRGSHSVLFAEIDHVLTGRGSGALVYFQRQFHQVRSPRAA